MTSPGPSRPPLEPSAVADRLAGSRWSAQVLAASPSTNAEAAARVRAGAGEGLVVVADHQTAGRGRLDRTWVTPPRSALTMSVVLAPDAVPVARWPWLPLLMGVAVVEGVRRACGLRCALKWPNDVLLDGAKLAGILVERVERPEGAAAVVSGFLYGVGRPGANSMAIGVGVVITVVLDAVLIRGHGAVGAAIASSTAYLATTAALLLMFRRVSRSSRPVPAVVSA